MKIHIKYHSNYILSLILRGFGQSISDYNLYIHSKSMNKQWSSPITSFPLLHFYMISMNPRIFFTIITIESMMINFLTILILSIIIFHLIWMIIQVAQVWSFLHDTLVNTPSTTANAPPNHNPPLETTSTFNHPQ